MSAPNIRVGLASIGPSRQMLQIKFLADFPIVTKAVNLHPSGLEDLDPPQGLDKPTMTPIVITL